MKTLRFPRVCRHVAGCLLVMSVLPLPAQNLLPNPRFDEGQTVPDAWTLQPPSAPAGKWWVNRQILAVEGTGDDHIFWRAQPQPPLAPGHLYRFTFLAHHSPLASGGTVVAGPSRVNRDFRTEVGWKEYTFVFRVPDNGGGDYVRLGQWHMRGQVEFQEAALYPVSVSHRRVSEHITLGEGERIEQGVYHFSPHFGWEGANAHRPLWRCTAGFNTDRWVFHPDAEVVYRFAVPGHAQRQGHVDVALNYYVNGVLRVEAARREGEWVLVGGLGKDQRNGSFDLPAALFPAEEIFVRLRAEGLQVNLQVNQCDYQAQLEGGAPDAEGATWFLETHTCPPDLDVQLAGIEPQLGHKRLAVTLRITNRRSQPRVMHGLAWCEPGLRGTGSRPPSIEKPVTLPPGQPTSLTLYGKVNVPGEHEVQVSLAGDNNSRLEFVGQTRVRLSWLEDPRPGYPLARLKGLTLWWCESGWKIGRDRPPPEGEYPDLQAEAVAANAAKLSLAKGEYEPVQIILTPAEDGTILGAEIKSFTDAQGRPAPLTAQVDEVAYVHVTHPTDATCVRGWYPDPLPPLKPPLRLVAGRNQPLWVTVYCPREAKGGDYTANLVLRTSWGPVCVPVHVHVYDFALPEQTHLRSALGLSTGAINQYHKLKDPAQQREVYEKYLLNFAQHRISPYSFFAYSPIRLRFEGEGADKRAVLDFTAFDAAAEKWIDQHHFNSFRLPVHGMGGGTFHSRHLGELEGFKEGTPEHMRLFRDYLSQVEAHLRERGWLDEAFVYWFDEPDPKDYAFVVAGMDRIHAAAPGLKRLLTEQPEPELIGHVDIWCALTPHWTRERVAERRRAGEEVWWYICTGPKAPYVTEFIDHPGTELRLWPWQSWQYGVTGILIWQTVYWTSPLAYPRPALQDPWKDPMSWVTGYGNPVGTRRPWGNGDGRFLYPPRRDPNTATEPCLDAPINSMRWENLRDGIEDYEYLWMLGTLVFPPDEPASGDTLGVPGMGHLLVVPGWISRSLTEFTTDPRPILDHRDKVARAIEKSLQAGHRLPE